MNRHEWPSPQELREAEEGEAEVWQRLASRLKVNTKSGGVWDRIVLEQAYYDEIGQHVDIETIVAKYKNHIGDSVTRHLPAAGGTAEMRRERRSWAHGTNCTECSLDRRVWTR